MKKNLIILLLLVFVMLISGCLGANQQSEQNPTPEEPKVTPKVLAEYFPLTVGSVWEYQGEGNEYASFTREVFFASGNRYQTMEDNGGTVMAIIYQVTEDAVTRTYSEGEVYDKINLLDKEANENTIILKSPLESGNKWQTADTTREIVDINATVQTPAGKYDNCIKVSVSSEHSTIYEYYKEGVGLVKREFISEGLEVTSSLKSFNVQ